MILRQSTKHANTWLGVHYSLKNNILPIPLTDELANYFLLVVLWWKSKSIKTDWASRSPFVWLLRERNLEEGYLQCHFCPNVSTYLLLFHLSKEGCNRNKPTVMIMFKCTHIVQSSQVSIAFFLVPIAVFILIATHSPISTHS